MPSLPTTSLMVTWIGGNNFGISLIFPSTVVLIQGKVSENMYSVL